MSAVEIRDDTTPGSLPLTVAQPGLQRGCAGYERVARQRALGLDALTACRNAGYRNISPKNAQRMVQNARIKARVAYLTRAEEEVIREQRAMILERQWLWHDYDVADFYEVVSEPLMRDGEVVIGDDGHPIMRQVQRLKPLDALSPAQRQCIDASAPSLRLVNKVEANRDLRKLLGLDKPAKVAETDAEGNSVERKTYTDLELARWIAAQLTAGAKQADAITQDG
jgi:hypothetical protein